MFSMQNFIFPFALFLFSMGHVSLGTISSEGHNIKGINVGKNDTESKTSTVEPQCGIATGRINSPNCTMAFQSIVGGTDAAPKAWPWQLILFVDGKKWCGAVLIHPRFALTAAHCTHLIAPSRLAVTGGTTHLYAPKNWISFVSNVHPYPGYTHVREPKFDHDISIIEFRTPAPLSDQIFPICLPDTESMLHGHDCYTTGWGTTRDYAKDMRMNLQETCVPFIPTALCYPYYMYETIKVTPNMVCAGRLNGGRNFCKGDSGGPLACKKDGRWLLFGIISWTKGCAHPGYPSVFTKVANYYHWIKYTTKQNL